MIDKHVNYESSMFFQTESVRKNPRKMRSVWSRLKKFLARPKLLYQKNCTARTRKRRGYGSVDETNIDKFNSSSECLTIT